MINRRWSLAAAAAGMCAAGFALRGEVGTSPASAQSADRVFELQIYTAPPGKIEAMKARFKDHVVPMFEKHGMTVIGFWTAADAPKSAERAGVSEPRGGEEELGCFPAIRSGRRSGPRPRRTVRSTSRSKSMYINPVAYSRIK